MKLYRIYLIIMSLFVLSSCVEDVDTNYKTLVKPVIDNPDKDPNLFINNNVYSIRRGERLEITPNIVYHDMGDLRYEWQIDNKVVSTDKDLEWLNESTEKSHFGIFAIYRKSAGNADIYTFTVERNIPFKLGFSILAKENNQLKMHFIQLGADANYTPTFHRDANPNIPSSTANGRMLEFWSCENQVLGELMYVDADPNKCNSYNGESLDTEVSLLSEFNDGVFPNNLTVKDIMFSGYVSYVLDASGAMYPRNRGKGYYTGRYLSTPATFEGKPLNISKMISVPLYKSDMCMVYDVDHKLYMIESGYTSDQANGGTYAGAITQITAFGADLNRTLLNCSYIIPSLFTSEINQFWSLSKGEGVNAGKYYARQFNFIIEDHAVASYKDDYNEEVTDMNENSHIIVMQTNKTPQAHIYYTNGTDQKSLYVRKRNADDMGQAELFHTFTNNIVSLAEYTPGSATRLLIGFDDGSIMLYAMKANDIASYTEYSADNISFEEKNLGQIVQTFYKFGNVAQVK